MGKISRACILFKNIHRTIQLRKHFGRDENKKGEKKKNRSKNRENFRGCLCIMHLTWVENEKFMHIHQLPQT